MGTIMAAILIVTDLSYENRISDNLTDQVDPITYALLASVR